MNFDESQLNAIKKATQSNSFFTVITGGAGTGKTTIIKEVDSLFVNSGRKVELMSPTGKAAARLSEATNRSASTIHRALKSDGTTFRRSKHEKIDVAIIDESSMIESGLLAQILQYSPKKIVLVGDGAQLQPVGKGSPFKDIINLRPDVVAKLSTCHRAKGAIHHAAQLIREGKSPSAESSSGGEKWCLKQTGQAEATVQTLIRWIKSGHYDPKQDLILSPRYKSDGGIDEVNRLIREVVNPSPEKWEIRDRVINTKNFSNVGNTGLWNGDVGTITSINASGNAEIILDRENSTIHARKPILLEKEQMKELKHAYCLSVHKAQGSEARRVFFLCFMSHFMQLSRSLIYTAITRAKEGAVVLGEMKAFYSGLNKIDSKTTVLQFLGEQAS